MDDSEQRINGSTNITGDTIGTTAYSERFVLNILIKVLSLSELSKEELENFIEKELCVIWDMTTENDVSEFLVAKNATEIFCDALKSCDNPRLAEVIIGILANMCSHHKVIEEVTKKEYIRKNVYNYLTSDDSLIIIQVMRFIFSNIYYDSSNLESWLQFFIENEFSEAIRYLLTNSMNKDVLSNTFETINCVCNCTNTDRENKNFVTLFVNEEFLKATLVGYDELKKCISESERELERCETVFLSIHSVLSNFKTHAASAYENIVYDFTQTVYSILSKHIENGSGAIVDIIQYITASLFIINKTDVEGSKNIFYAMLKLWSNVVKSKNSNGLDFEHNLEIYKEVEDILPQYFVRSIKVFPAEDLKTYFSGNGKINAELLSSKIKEMISSKEINEYFSDIPIYLDNLI